MMPSESLASSYGPLGKSKILITATGTTVVSRDGEQMLDMLVGGKGEGQDEEASTALDRLLLSSCASITKRFGDGSLSTLMVTNSLMSLLECKDGMKAMNVRHRVSTLQSVELLISLLQREQDVIWALMRSACLWKDLEGCETRWIRALWMTSLVPATNSNVAIDIESLMWRWLGKCGRNSSSNNSSELCRRCEYALKHFEDLVISSTRSDGNASLSSSYCVPLHHVLLDGRCRDFTAFTISAAAFSTLSAYKFVCLKNMLPLAPPSSSSLSSFTAKVTVQVSSFLDVVSGTSYQVASTQMLADTLKAKHIQTVFCCDKIEQAALHAAASMGLVVIDCVPFAHLKRLCESFSVTLFFSPLDLQLAFEAIVDSSATTGAATTSRPNEPPSSSTGTASFGTFTRLERVSFGSSNTLLRIIGTTHSEGRGEPDLTLVPQLVLQANSTISQGIYKRALKRCLRIGSSALSKPLLVPGAGAGEMMWSTVWSGVSHALSPHFFTSSLPSTLIPPLLIPLVSHIVAKIHDRLGNRNSSLLLHVASICQKISISYLAPPLRLIASCHSCHDASLKTARGQTRLLLLWQTNVASSTWTMSQGFVLSLRGNFLAEPLAFRDAFEHGVVCSSHQFWQGFIATLEACRLCLRIGGASGVIRITRKTKQETQLAGKETMSGSEQSEDDD